MQEISLAFFTALTSILASNGFWSYKVKKLEKLKSERDKDGLETQMLKGLAHDKIGSLAKQYIERGYITYNEYENLYTYLYVPYIKLGGNGYIEELIRTVQELPKRI